MPHPMHNPGSAEAIGRGCTCDFIKNNFGRGHSDADGTAFYCSDTCRVHGVLLAINEPATSPKSGFETAAALKWLWRAARTFKPPS
jgi:hypothetical protein